MYNKSLLQKYMKCLFDILALVIGALSFLFSFFGFPKTSLVFCSLSALLCVVYLLYAIYLLCNKVKFDWHLINGNYFRKVVCIVILLPSLFVTCINLHYSPILHRSEPQKELVFDNSLYMVNDQINSSIRIHQESPSLYWSVFYHFVDPGNQHMTTTKTGRTWAALIAIVGVFVFNGLLVTTVIAWIDRRKERWMKGEARYRNILKHNLHYIVIGGNDVVIGIVKQLLEEVDTDNPYILIQTSRDIELFRKELFSTLNTSQQQRIIIYYGNRTSITDISELHLEEAKEVYIIGEDTRADDIESYHDTMNMECLKLLSDYIKDINLSSKNTPLVCRIMFEYQTTFNVLQVTDIDGDKIKFLPFNYYESWAQNVFVCQELENKENCKYLPLEGFDGIQTEQNKFVHLIIVGMSRMGVAMAIEAAHLAHFPNYETKKLRTKITFIDKNASEEKDYFMGRFKELFSLSHWRYAEIDDNGQLFWCKQHIPTGFEHLGGDFIDIEWEFINSSIENPTIQRYLIGVSACKNAKLTIAICLPENSRAIAAATYMHDSVYMSESTLQVLVYQRLNNNLLIQINQNKRYCSKLKAFGMTSKCYDSNLVKLSDFIASKVDKAYNQYNWNLMISRYNGNGLIDDDYNSLSDNCYENNIEKKDLIKNECDTWIADNYKLIYEEAKVNMKIFKEEIINKKYNKDRQKNESSKSIGKTKTSKLWSNKYNSLSMWTKFRCVSTLNNNKFNPLKNTFENSMLVELGKMEHNRWVMEQLLLRYGPLNKEQQEKAKIVDLYASQKQKDIYKNGFSHLDICSNDKLLSVDCNVNDLDKRLIEILPSAYREYLLMEENK